MKHVRISIIIPAYNEARYLPGCLEAIAAQTVQPYEVIVVDNDSSDATARIARSYGSVRLVKESRRGIVFARNAGFAAARGTVLARIDADTRLPANWVARVSSFYSRPQHKNDVLTGGSRFYDLRFGYVYGRLYDFTVHRLNRLFLGCYFPWGSNCAFPASAWAKISTHVSERTDIHEDFDLGLCLHDVGYETVYEPNLRVVVAARILRRPKQIWAYLAMWPRGYRVHRLRTWPVIWALAFMVWAGSLLVVVLERVTGALLSDRS